MKLNDSFLSTGPNYSGSMHSTSSGASPTYTAGSHSTALQREDIIAGVGITGTDSVASRLA